MATTTRQWQEIDLMTLYHQTTHKEWNAYLAQCLKYEDILQLEKTYYGIQAGMDSLVKKKLSDDKMTNWFLRLTKSIEITVKTIYRQKYPSRLDDPITAQALKIDNPKEYNKQLQLKRNRDQLYEKWLRKVAF